MPNWKKVITSGSDAALNNVTASNGIQVGGNILPDSDNTLSLGTSDLRFQLNGGTPVTVTGSGTANTLTRFQSATTVEDSNIFSSDTLTRISHDNDGNDIFIVSGSNGELIKVTDSVTDTLFQVNDGSGITKLEVSSSGLTTTSDVEIDDWGSVSASLAALDVSASSADQNLQDVTDNGATTTNNITIDGGSDARLTLDRNANSNDAEIVFKTNGSENWSIGTGQVGGDASFTIRGQGAANYFVLDTDGDLSVTNSGSFGHLSVDNEVSSSDVNINNWGSVSSSLADLNSSIDGIDSSVTLQDATDNGSTTTNEISTPNILINSSSTNHIIKYGYQAASNAVEDTNGGVIIGQLALSSSNNSVSNTVIIGPQAMYRYTGGSIGNTVIGTQAASYLKSGINNTILGEGAMNASQVTSSNYNTAIGVGSLKITRGEYNLALGYNAGYQQTNGSGSIYIGRGSGKVTDGGSYGQNNSIYLGNFTSPFNTTTPGGTSNEVVIGTGAKGNGTNTVTIGSTSITDNYFSGNISGSDIKIDDWGSVSASLASLDVSGVVSGSSQITISDTTGYTAFSSSIASDIAAIDSSVTLQDATVNGNTTDTSMILESSASRLIISASGTTTQGGGSDDDISGIITTRNISNSGQSNRDGQDTFKRAVDGYTYNTYHTEGGFGAGLPRTNGDKNYFLRARCDDYVGATFEYTIYNMAQLATDILGARTGTAHYVFHNSGSGAFSLTDTTTTDLGPLQTNTEDNSTGHWILTGSLSPGDQEYFEFEVQRVDKPGASVSNNGNIVGTFKLHRRNRFTPGDDVAIEIGGAEVEMYTDGGTI